MTRVLYILRHGKSDHGGAAGEWADDHERPLKRRGREAASRMGSFLERIGERPDLALSSTAARARTTAELALEAMGGGVPLETTRAVYEMTARELLPRLGQRDDSVERLLLVGHQPTLGELIAVLTAGAEPLFPTAALARIELDVEAWSDVRQASGALAWLVTPRLLEPFV